MFLDYLVAFNAIRYVYIISFLPKHMQGDYIIKAALPLKRRKNRTKAFVTPERALDKCTNNYSQLARATAAKMPL